MSRILIILILQDGKHVLKEGAEVLLQTTCAVTVTVQEVEEFIADKEVIKKKYLAGMMTAMYMEAWKGLQLEGLSIEGVPIQELMICLTESKGA